MIWAIIPIDKLDEVVLIPSFLCATKLEVFKKLVILEFLYGFSFLIDSLLVHWFAPLILPLSTKYPIPQGRILLDDASI